MPFIKFEKADNGAAVGLWKIEESEEQLIQLMEQDPVLQLPTDDVSNVTKRKEWMAGRLILKALVEHLGLKYKGIYKDQAGKPHLNFHPHHISLTHSFPWVGAIICEKGAVGIDLEQPKEKLTRIAYKFLSETEQEDACNDIEKLCVYWCAKEALYKQKGQKGVIFKENLIVDPFVLSDEVMLNGTITLPDSKNQHKLKAEKINKTYLVYTFN